MDDVNSLTIICEEFPCNECGKNVKYKFGSISDFYVLEKMIFSIKHIVVNASEPMI